MQEMPLLENNYTEILRKLFMAKKYLSCTHNGTQPYVCEVWLLFFGYVCEEIYKDISSCVQEWIYLQITQHTRKNIWLSNSN